MLFPSKTTALPGTSPCLATSHSHLSRGRRAARRIAPLFLGRAGDVQALDAVAQRIRRGFRIALPHDLLGPADFQEGHLAAGVAYEQVAVGQGLDAGEPADAGLRNLAGLQRPDDVAGGVELDDGVLPANQRMVVPASRTAEYGANFTLNSRSSLPAASYSRAAWADSSATRKWPSAIRGRCAGNCGRVY